MVMRMPCASPTERFRVNKMKWFLFLVITSGGCDHSEEDARKLVKLSAGSGEVRCVNEGGEGVSVSFCTNGKTLAICTSDDGCITVNVTAEAVVPN